MKTVFAHDKLHALLYLETLLAPCGQFTYYTLFRHGCPAQVLPSDSKSTRLKTRHTEEFSSLVFYDESNEFYQQ